METMEELGYIKTKKFDTGTHETKRFYLDQLKPIYRKPTPQWVLDEFSRLKIKLTRSCNEN